MSVEIIYEKKYPRIDPMEEMKQIEMEMWRTSQKNRLLLLRR